MSRTVNLARQRFVNSRPVIRLSVLLWGLALALAALNGWRYYGYMVGSGERADRLGELERSIAAERSQIEALDRQLREADLGVQNVTVAFLNRKIGERTFAWSQLFEQLGELMPDATRIVALSPVVKKRGRQNESELAQRVVPLAISGEAKDEPALYAFVDALFDHAAFRQPSPSRQAWQQNGLLRFELSVEYLPDATEGTP